MNTNERKETFLYTPVEKNTDAINFYLCFPGSYYVGMSSLAFLTLFSTLDQQEFIKPTRVFSDSSMSKLQDNSLCGFTFSFELDFIQIFKMLDKYQIPLKKELRTDKDPLIFAGGPVVSTNPEPFADLFDFFVIGDGDDVIIEISKVIHQNIKADRKTRLEHLANIKGVYVPEFYDVSYNEDFTLKQIFSLNENAPETIQKICRTYDDQCLFSPILSNDTVFSNTLLIEVERGCSHNCLFCITSSLNKPVRWPSKDCIIDAIDAGLEHSRHIGLLGALITENPDLEEILSYIYNKHGQEAIKLTTSSLRADKINDNIASILSGCNQKQVTISVEAGTERLRKKLNKSLTDNDILKCIDTCAKNNINTVKLYGMLGLPDENEQDHEGMVSLLKEIKQKNPKVELILSLNSFIPKAHTPFERAGIQDSSYISKRMKYIQKELLKISKVRTSSTKWDYIQALISRGDRRLYPVLLKAYEYGLTLGSFNRAFKDFQTSIPEINWYASRKRELKELLPWDHIKF